MVLCRKILAGNYDNQNKGIAGRIRIDAERACGENRKRATQYQQLENGSSEPDCETLVRLADVFGVTMDELFGRNEEPERGALQSEPYYKLIKRLNDRQSDALKSFLSAFCE